MQKLAEQIADEILVMEAQEGRPEAFDMLESLWQKHLWLHAPNFTGRAKATCDITQGG